MISQYKAGDPQVVLKTDLGGEFPLYLYLAEDDKSLIYSKSFFDLVNDSRVVAPLDSSINGVGFLLQSAVVPPPKTAYERIYIVGIGDTAIVDSDKGKVTLKFSHQFPFMSVNRLPRSGMEPDENQILQMLGEATISRLDSDRQTFLFHSAGKDSNSIALALAEAGWQDKVTLITHRSKGDTDESEISKSIAKKLGFKHRILHEIDKFEDGHKEAIEEYFINAPFPCTDNVCLAYPLYAKQIPELKGANLIDGGGNDSYMATPPKDMQRKTIPIAKFASLPSFLRRFVSSESLLNIAVRTPAEWCGPWGLSYKDSALILNEVPNVFNYWKEESSLRSDWDLYDFKSDLYSTRAIAEIHIRKARNFADSIQAKLVLPFTDEKLVNYFAKMPEEYLFDRKSDRNKIILRDILKKRIGLDSDALGNKGFTYDSTTMIRNNREWILKSVRECKLWNKTNLHSITARMSKRMDGTGWAAGAASRNIYRLYLISQWHSRCRFVTGNKARPVVEQL